MNTNGRYFKITYNGEMLIELFAANRVEAKKNAVRHYQLSGRRGMNLARIEVS